MQLSELGVEVGYFRPQLIAEPAGPVGDDTRQGLGPGRAARPQRPILRHHRKIAQFRGVGNFRERAQDGVQARQHGGPLLRPAEPLVVQRYAGQVALHRHRLAEHLPDLLVQRGRERQPRLVKMGVEASQPAQFLGRALPPHLRDHPVVQAVDRAFHARAQWLDYPVPLPCEIVEPLLLVPLHLDLVVDRRRPGLTGLWAKCGAPWMRRHNRLCAGRALCPSGSPPLLLRVLSCLRTNLRTASRAPREYSEPASWRAHCAVVPRMNCCAWPTRPACTTTHRGNGARTRSRTPSRTFSSGRLPTPPAAPRKQSDEHRAYGAVACGWEPTRIGPRGSTGRSLCSCCLGGWAR